MISGQVFSASEPIGNATAPEQPIFNPRRHYTWVGNFTMNKQGSVVNSSGQVLNGWTVDPTGGLGGARATFHAASDNPVPSGTIGSISGGTGTVATSHYAAGANATPSFTADFGNSQQAIALYLGIDDTATFDNVDTPLNDHGAATNHVNNQISVSSGKVEALNRVFAPWVGAGMTQESVLLQSLPSKQQPPTEALKIADQAPSASLKLFDG